MSWAKSMDFVSVEPPVQQCTVWFCWDKMTTVWLSSGINTIFHTHHCTFKTSSLFLYFLDQLLDPYFDICSGLHPLNIDSLPHTEFSGMTTCVKGFLAVHSYPFECWDCFRQTKEIGLLGAVLHWQPRFKNCHFDATYLNDSQTNTPAWNLYSVVLQANICHS